LHSVKAGEEIAATATHEFGHLVDFGLQNDSRVFTPAVSADGTGIISSLHTDFSGTHRAKASLSRYATSDPKDARFPAESFAEGFSASYHQRASKHTAYTKRVKKYRKILTSEVLNQDLTTIENTPTFTAVGLDVRGDVNETINSIYDRLGLDRFASF